MNMNNSTENYLLQNTCKITEHQHYAQIQLPFFFPQSNSQLELLVTERDGSVTVSDNGAAYRELAAKTSDATVLDKTFAYFLAVYLNTSPSESKEVCWTFSSSYMHRFFRVLQCISLCANADLYPAVNQKEWDKCLQYLSCETFSCSDGVYPAQFIEEIKEAVIQEKDWIFSDFAFDGEMTDMSIRTADTQDGRVVLTDDDGFDGGGLIERLEWYHQNDGYHQYDAFIRKICERFCAEYDGKKVRYSFRQESDKSIAAAVMTFLQLMSILGETGITVLPDMESNT